MGWNIYVDTNSVKVNKEIAKELFEKCSGIWYREEEVMNDEYLYFDQDHMEHMDYITNKNVQKILKKHKVKGIIGFTSPEGDNRGSSWGYEFDGLGNMFELKGTIQWQRV